MQMKNKGRFMNKFKKNYSNRPCLRPSFWTSKQGLSGRRYIKPVTFQYFDK